MSPPPSLPAAFYLSSKTPANNHLSRCVFSLCLLICPSPGDTFSLPLTRPVSVFISHPFSPSVPLLTQFLSLLTTSLSTQQSYHPTDHPLILDAPPPPSKDAPGCVLVTPPTEIKS